MTLTMPEVADGVFDVGVVATIAGVYRFHVVATGATRRGLPFTREQPLTGTAVIHGDGPFPTSGPDTHVHDEQLCALLECLVSGEALGRFFAKEGINGAALLACVRRYCAERTAPPTPEQLAEREGTLPPGSSDIASILAQPDMLTQIADLIRRAGWTRG